MTFRSFLCLCGIGITFLIALYFLGFLKPNPDKVKFVEIKPVEEKQDQKQDDKKDDKTNITTNTPGK